MNVFRAVALLGPRQYGKTTLAKQINAQHFFDLENPRDFRQLDEPQLALENLEGLIVIDEVQRKPELFTLLRYLIDQKRNQKFLILGSASKELIQQSSESLAGRIAYVELRPFSLKEINDKQLKRLWMRGGFPESFLAKNEKSSVIWREQYITTFLERDIPQLGIQIPARTLRRFWIMLSHYHGQVMNHAELGRAFGISHMTVKKYIDILAGTFMVRVLLPWHTNTKKRLVKSPKIYIRDSGIFHTLQSIESQKDLMTNPKLGASWEGFAIEQLIQHLNLQEEQVYFWATHSGAELDVFWQRKGKNYGAEIKYADAPQKTPSMKSAIQDLGLEKLWVIYPGDQKYALDKNIETIPLCKVSGI